MMAPFCEQPNTNLFSFNSSSCMVKLYSFSPLSTMITTMFQEKSNMYHISEPIIRRFFFQNVCYFVYSRAVFIDSLSFAMKRYNTSQGFGAFFVQSSDRFSFRLNFFSHFSRSFLIFFKILVRFLIKQLFYSGLLDIK